MPTAFAAGIFWWERMDSTGFMFGFADHKGCSVFRRCPECPRHSGFKLSNPPVLKKQKRTAVRRSLFCCLLPHLFYAKPWQGGMDNDGHHFCFAKILVAVRLRRPPTAHWAVDLFYRIHSAGIKNAHRFCGRHFLVGADGFEPS